MQESYFIRRKGKKEKERKLQPPERLDCGENISHSAMIE
jgi:hypothetical protein